MENTREDLINALAEEAAQSAVDVAGGNIEYLPTALAALEFVTAVRYDTGIDEEQIRLSPKERTTFRHSYCRHLRNLGVAVGDAIARSF